MISHVSPAMHILNGVDLRLALKAAVEAAKLVDAAVKAYAFHPTAYTYAAMQSLMRVQQMFEDAGIDVDQVA